MRRAAGTLAVLVAATLGGLWIARPLRSAPALEARAVAITMASTTTTAKPDTPASVAPLAGPFQIAKVVPGSVEVHTAPDGPLLRRISNPLYATIPLLFLVKRPVTNTGWVEVHLPTRPNGSSGFVRASDVSLSETGMQILVEQRFRRLSVWDGGRLVFETPVAVGKDKTPTPNGVYYVQGIVRASGAYGPFIMALSSHSEVHKTFAGGDGLVGIHGTNQPGLIGQAVSNGCIRLPNAAITQVVRLVPSGAPVTVVP
jgi:lipoprotein-anchoring transpeptidase ErfK/SrfK